MCNPITFHKHTHHVLTYTCMYMYVRTMSLDVKIKICMYVCMHAIVYIRKFVSIYVHVKMVASSQEMKKELRVVCESCLAYTVNTHTVCS